MACAQRASFAHLVTHPISSDGSAAAGLLCRAGGHHPGAALRIGPRLQPTAIRSIGRAVLRVGDTRRGNARAPQARSGNRGPDTIQGLGPIRATAPGIEAFHDKCGLQALCRPPIPPLDPLVLVHQVGSRMPAPGGDCSGIVVDGRE